MLPSPIDERTALTSPLVDLVFPESCSDLLYAKLMEHRPPPHYFRVSMHLGDILDREFFTEYVKRGNILMLSEGNSVADNVFTLRDGHLTMYLDKETFERAGLVGKPYGVKGNRGLKPRWVVSYDLKSPTMLHGKKGFDRLVYACKQVLSQRNSWLFCNRSESYPEPDPLSKHFPVKFDAAPAPMQNLDTSPALMAIPPSILTDSDRPRLEEWASELYEWFSLVRLMSPRILAGDNVDPYLSRYDAPAGGSEDKASNTRLSKVSWQGFMASDWFHRLLVDILVAWPTQSWFYLSATTVSKGSSGDGKEVAFLRPSLADGEYLMWEIASAE
ncbi:Ribonuclease P protein subunit p40 [Paramyrothecium foliicola]|nr:Ribonuclease P protein subunit p40 [Paramyrothecium foliicola]